MCPGETECKSGRQFTLSSMYRPSVEFVVPSLIETWGIYRPICWFGSRTALQLGFSRRPNQAIRVLYEQLEQAKLVGWQTDWSRVRTTQTGLLLGLAIWAWYFVCDGFYKTFSIQCPISYKSAKKL